MIKKFISASAGTGKTHRILKDIFDYDASGKPQNTKAQAEALISQSVFLTFSNSAAEEIRDRIHDSLHQCAGYTAGKISLVEEFSGFITPRVFTIHAFALEVARIFRYELGLPAEMDFSNDENNIWKEAVKEFFRKDWNCERLFEICGAKDNEIQKAIITIFYYVSQKTIGNLINFMKDKGNDLFFLTQLGVKPPVRPDQKNLDDILKRVNFKAPEEEAFKIIDLIKTIEEFKDKDQELANFVNTKQQREILETAGAVLHAADFVINDIANIIGENIYMAEMFKEGVFDYDAVIFLVIKDVIKSKGIKDFMKKLDSEGYGFKELYIDEAQDNDIMQNYFVSLFSDEIKCTDVKITVVGDIKQSIYAWRGSYPEEFSEIYKEMKEFSKVTKGNQVENLNETQRITDNKTRETINEVFKNIKGNNPNWWYDIDPEKDPLKENTRFTITDEAQLEYWKYVKAETNHVTVPEIHDMAYIKKFLSSGKCGIIARTRKEMMKSHILENLTDLKYRMNVKIDAFEKAEEGKASTMLPELNVAAACLGTVLTCESQAVPFLMLFTKPGKLLCQKLKHKFDQKDFLSAFKGLYYAVQKDARKQEFGTRAETVLDIMDENNMWANMKHISQDVMEKRMIRRTVNHIIAKMALAEKNSGGYFDAEQTMLDVLEAGELPFEWFSIKPPEKFSKDEGKQNIVEVTTIHACKGLQYDKVVVISDFDKSFFGNYRNIGKYSNYGYMFTVHFDNILKSKGEPGIKISYFPYLGNVTPKVLKAGCDFYPGALANFNAIEQSIQAECLNLLYVAATRTKKDMIFVDLGAGEQSKMVWSAFQNRRDVIGKQLKDKKGFEDIQYNNMNMTAKITEADFGINVISVRDHIKSKYKIKYGANTNSLKEKTDRAATGTAAHAMVQNIVTQAKSAAEFEKEADKLASTAVKGTIQKRATDILVSKAAKIAIVEAESMLKSGYSFHHELQVWGFPDDFGNAVRGAMDTTGFNSTSALIAEYKVVFKGDKGAQEKGGIEQLKVYGGLLKDMGTGKTKIETKLILFNEEKV